MQEYLKFLKRLPKPLRNKLLLAIDQLAANEFEKLDIKPLSGNKHFYHCRVGKIRIIFQKTKAGSQIYDIGFRGDVY